MSLANLEKGPCTKREFAILFSKGIGMGIADLIPGVSGGTIAFIGGIYPQLLNAIESVNKRFLIRLLKFQIKEAFGEIHARFIITLGLGIMTAVILFSRLMHYLLVHHSLYTWSFFFGLIALSIPSLAKRVDNPLAYKNIILFISGAVGAYFAVGIIPVETPSALWFIGLCGFIGIFAMILPGISGSFILLILGKYELIISALKNPFQGDHPLIIMVFSTGAVLSLVSISRLLGHFFKKYPNPTTIFLTGVLLGSMRKIWPWKEAIQSIVVRGEKKALEFQSFIPEFSFETIKALAVMAFGGLVIWALNRLDKNASLD